MGSVEAAAEWLSEGWKEEVSQWGGEPLTEKQQPENNKRDRGIAEEKAHARQKARQKGKGVITRSSAWACRAYAGSRGT